MQDELTIAQLWAYARAHKLENAAIRVCDGMACSFYVTRSAIGRAPMEIVIDVSSLPIIEYDDLTKSAKRVTFATH